MTSREAATAVGAAISIERHWANAPLSIPGDSDTRKLWRGLAACHQDALVDLAATIAGVPDAAQALRELQAIGLADPLDASRVRLSAASRIAAAIDDSVRMQHARAVHAAVLRSDWRVISDVRQALEYALGSDWILAQDLGRRTASYLREQRRNEEAAELLHIVLSVARLRADDHIRTECEWELSWLEDAPHAVRTPILSRGQLALF
jgi:hypothetical protein